MLFDLFSRLTGRTPHRHRRSDRVASPRRRLSTFIESLEERRLLTVAPYTSSAADKAWMTSLETGTGVVAVPSTGVVIDRQVIVTSARRVLGGQNPIHFVGNGRILVAMDDPASKFELRDAKIDWYRDPAAMPNNYSAVYALNGGLTFSRNTVTSNVDPRPDRSSVWFDGPPLNWFLQVGSTTSNVSSLTVEDNTFTCTNAYSTGLLVMSGTTTVSGVDINRNYASNFQGGFNLRHLVGASVDDNRFFRNALGSIFVDDATVSEFSRNTIELPGNGTTGDGMSLSRLSRAVVAENTITNGSCYGIWMFGGSSDTTFYRNTIQGAITSGISISNPDNVGSYSNITLLENVLTGNLGWGVEAKDVSGLTLVGNIIGGNHVLKGRQHFFTNVTGVSARSNLFVPETPGIADYGSVGGTNVSQYVFGDVPVVATTASVEAPDTAWRKPLVPTTSAATNAQWLAELESGSGTVAIPPTGIRIDRQVVIRNPRLILGGGNTLQFTGTGRLVVAMANPTDKFTLSNVSVLWNHAGVPAKGEVVFLQRGNLTLSGNLFFADADARDCSGSSLFTLAGDAKSPSTVTFNDNTFINRYWSTFNLINAPTSSGINAFVFTDNNVANFDGGLVLSGAANVQILRNEFSRNTQNNLDLSNIAGGQIAGNRFLFAGNGQGSADAIAIADSDGLTIARNVVFQASRNGVSLLRTMNTTLKDNVISRSALHGIKIDTASTLLPRSTGLTVDGNMFVLNAGYGLFALRTAQITITGNLFQDNTTDPKDQYRLDDVVAPKVSGNVLDYAQTVGDITNPKGNGTNVEAYDVPLIMNSLAQSAIISADANWYSARSTTLIQNWKVGAGAAWQDVQAGDVNGDGRTDLVGRVGSTLLVALSNGSSFSVRQAGLWSSNVKWQDMRLADVNGDRRADWLGRTGDKWWVLLSKGNTFNTTASIWGAWSDTQDWKNVSLGDFNGDGRTDLVGRAGTGFWVSLSTGSNFKTSLWGRWDIADWHDVLVGDFNGDAKDDLYMRDGSRWIIAQSNAGGFTSVVLGDLSGEQLYQGATLADVNRDGKDDLVWLQNGNWSAGLSDGTRFSLVDWAAGPGNVAVGATLALDANGDGADDLLAYAGGKWRLTISDGNAWGTTTIVTGIPSADLSTLAAVDLDGDGRFEPMVRGNA